MTVNFSDLSDDQKFARAVQAANVPTLLMVLVQLTGDDRWMAQPYQPVKAVGLDDNDTGGLSEDLQREVRDAALAAINAWRQGKEPVLQQPRPDELVRMLTVAMDETIPAEYGPMMLEDMAAAGLAMPAAPNVPSANLKDRQAIIIGAGVSGLCAAMAFDRLGLDYVVLEKGDSVGGTWRDNKYPGAGVDTPNHL